MKYFLYDESTWISGYLIESVSISSWFMGALSRKESERLLLSPGNEMGCFLIRESETSPGIAFNMVNKCMIHVDLMISYE